MEVVGQVLAGQFGELLVRQKHGEEIEIGGLIAMDSEKGLTIMQVYNLLYGSQLPQSALELISGINLEGRGTNLELMDRELRSYVLAEVRGLVQVRDKKALTPKALPDSFTEVRQIKSEDLEFITRPEKPLYVGRMRSGSKVMDINVNVDAEDVLRHHILVPATTGRGKSNLVKVMSWSVLGSDFCGLLILDPHDEYYGRNALGLKDHPEAGESLSYYTNRDPPPGAETLLINVGQLRPGHLTGVINFTDAQREAIYGYHGRYGKEWVRAIVEGEDAPEGVKEESIEVLRRRLNVYLGLSARELEGRRKMACRGIFSDTSGHATVKNILSDLEAGKTVVIDTSTLEGSVELLIGSMIAGELFGRYKRYKLDGKLEEKPVVSIVLEEAPRVLGREALQRGPNIFSRIAREGRKFKVGLTAITQLPSLIPREILANMNTKIVLGIEMGPERRSIIESASQDLSKDDRAIASLDAGEAIVTSNFTQFAVPVKIPLFEEYASTSKGREAGRGADFSGMDMG